jgi:hypothetical protein
MSPAAAAARARLGVVAPLLGLGFLLGAWREGIAGALARGARHGAWCTGCCWALMASLFALGAMSLVWMAFVAAPIAIEKTVRRRPRRHGRDRRAAARARHRRGRRARLRAGLDGPGCRRGRGV